MKDKTIQKIFHKIPFLKKIYKLFFGPKRYKYLIQIIREIKPKKIMEIGVWDGDHAKEMINEARKHNKQIEYYGFDLFEDLDDKLYSKEAAKKPLALKEIKKRLKTTGAKIKLIKGDTRKTLPKKIKNFPQMDFIFIDGGHTLETIENDWKHSRKLMHKNTVVIFDDYWNRDDIGCKKVIESLDKQKYNVEILPIQDKFKKDWGVLEINFVKVTLS